MDENILNDSWEPKGTTSQEIKKRIIYLVQSLEKEKEDGGQKVERVTLGNVPTV